jgi:hypothetical protein
MIVLKKTGLGIALVIGILANVAKADKAPVTYHPPRDGFYAGGQVGASFNKYSLLGDIYNDVANARTTQEFDLTRGGIFVGILLGYSWQKLLCPLFFELGYRHQNAGSYTIPKRVTSGGVDVDAEAQPYAKIQGSFFTTLGITSHINDSLDIGFKLSLMLSQFRVKYKGDLSTGAFESKKNLIGIAPGMRIMWSSNADSSWSLLADYDYCIYSGYTTQNVAVTDDNVGTAVFRVNPTAHVISVGFIYKF